LFLLFLQEAEPLARPALRYRWEKKFGEQADYEFLYPALTELIRLDVVAEFDLEFAGVMDGASATHKEHGEIELADLTSYFGLDELLCLSRAAPAYAMEHVGALTREAGDLGLDKALATLLAMPIDSTAWTGLPRGFVFTEQTRQQLISMLEQADAALSRSGLSNFEVGQGSGLLKAALALAGTPEPPKSDIWSILNKGAAIASLASFFAPLLKLVRP
jgi:hypothetical protein